MDKIISLRRYLHQHPDRSGSENATRDYLIDFLKAFQPDKILELSGASMCLLYQSERKGPVTAFRAELDALPIQEKSTLAYKSDKQGVSHSCGHDGHMSILAGLAEKIALARPEKGTVILLFQAEEENGQGARALMNYKAFLDLEIERIFALHNIPGRKPGEILWKSGSFAAASEGLTIQLVGLESHAAEPEKGRNPAYALAQIIDLVKGENLKRKANDSLSFATIIHSKLGEKAFGTSPGKAEISLTLRAYENVELNILKSDIQEGVRQLAAKYKLDFEFSSCEVFPATVNNDECIQIIRSSVLENKLRAKEMTEPFRWSEDFGYYTRKIRGGFFGLGSGEQQAALHNPDYDFPDEILSTGINMFYSIYKQLHLNISSNA